jgi:hypothetical protein
MRGITTYSAIVTALVGIGADHGHADVIRFAGSGPDGNANIHIRHSTGSTVYGSPKTRSAEIEIDTENYTMLYENIDMDVSADTVITRSHTAIPSGGFNEVTVHNTITLNPFRVSATNVGPLALSSNLPSGTLYIEENLDGAYGAFGNLDLSGEYLIEGPTETFSGSFAFSVPPDPAYQFPKSELKPTDFPSSVSLGGGNWSHFNLRYEAIPPVFEDTVDGLPIIFHIENIFFHEATWLPLAVIPEPSTLVLLSMGALTITFGWWRRRRA